MNAFPMALDSIREKKGRSFLTMLDIIIGVTAVLVLVALVSGYNADVTAYYEKLGVNKVTVGFTWYDESRAGDAADIDYVGLDEAGSVAVLVLSDVTGDCYDYGILHAGVRTGKSGDMSYSNPGVAVENSGGTGECYITTASVTDGGVGGVAEGISGRAAGVVELTGLAGLTRDDFDGAETLAGIPISEGVQVYNAVTGKWVTLAQAKAFTDTFTAYYDRTPGTGGQVRVIFAGG